jgi:hypothetical protein
MIPQQPDLQARVRKLKERLWQIIVWLGRGLLAAFHLFAWVQVGRGLLFGVVQSAGRGQSGIDLTYQEAPIGFLASLVLWFLVGPFLEGGILVFIWLQRHDRY